MVFIQNEHFPCSLRLWSLSKMNIFNFSFLIFTEEVSRFECLPVGDAGVNNFVFRWPFLSHQPALHRDGTSAIDRHKLTYSINNFYLSWDVFVLWSAVFASIWIFHVISDEIGSCVSLFCVFGSALRCWRPTWSCWRRSWIATTAHRNSATRSPTSPCWSLTIRLQLLIIRIKNRSHLPFVNTMSHANNGSTSHPERQ